MVVPWSEIQARKWAEVGKPIAAHEFCKRLYRIRIVVEQLEALGMHLPDPSSLSDLAGIYCAAGRAVQNRLNIRHIEPLCSLYSSNFDLASPPARYESPKFDRLLEWILINPTQISQDGLE